MTFLERWLEDPARRARLRRWSLMGLAAVALAEVVLPWISGRHSHFAFEDFPAFGALYGLISCIAIIVVSKFLGKLWLMRREDSHDT